MGVFRDFKASRLQRYATSQAPRRSAGRTAGTRKPSSAHRSHSRLRAAAHPHRNGYTGRGGSTRASSVFRQSPSYRRAAAHREAGAHPLDSHRYYPSTHLCNVPHLARFPFRVPPVLTRTPRVCKGWRCNFIILARASGRTYTLSGLSTSFAFPRSTAARRPRSRDRFCRR